jgi:hypothetical protein
VTKVLPFDLGEAGITRKWVDNEDGTFTIISEQDTAPLLDLNRAMANHNDGYTPSRDMRRVASIPQVVMEAWLQEANYDQNAFKEIVAKRLDDPDWKWLRTADFRVGKKHRHI